MERYIFMFAAVALTGLGARLVLWPADVVERNRDPTETPTPPTAGEVLKTRGLGLFLLAGGGYSFYALLTGMQGAEFPPA